MQEQRETPTLMIAATTGMVAVSVVLTLFAGPLYEYAARAGERLMSPALLVEEVLGDQGGPGSGSGDTEAGNYDPLLGEGDAS